MRAPRILLIDDDPNDKGVRNGAVYLPKPFPLAALDRVVQIVLTDRQLLAESSPDKFEEEHFLETSPIYADCAFDPFGTRIWQTEAFCGLLP